MPPDNSNLPSPADSDALLTELRRLARRNRRLSRLCRGGVFTILPIVMLSGVRDMIGKHHPLSKWLSIVEFAIYVPYFAALGSGIIEQWISKNRRRTLIHELEEDVRSVGPLLLLLHENQDKEIERVVQETLKPLLTRIQFSDARHFTPEQIETLLGLLKNDDYDLRIAVVKALEQIGDSRAILPLQQTISAAFFPDLKLAAQTALDAVKAKAEGREKAVTLLVPSDSYSATSDVLLRSAAVTQSDTAPEQLLRPIQ